MFIIIGFEKECIFVTMEIKMNSLPFVPFQFCLCTVPYRTVPAFKLVEKDDFVCLLTLFTNADEIEWNCFDDTLTTPIMIIELARKKFTMFIFKTKVEFE